MSTTADTRRTSDFDTSRIGALCLGGAAALFWIAWLLMPGVGITDEHEILTRVAANRESVMLSVAIQLLSAALYAPALVALALRAFTEKQRALVVASVVMLAGAMGSAADAVFHWLAVEMTAPGTDAVAMLPVMARMQGPGLVIVVPLVAAFFLGTWTLAFAAIRARWIGWGSLAFAIGGPVVGLAIAALSPEHARVAGLAVLACFAGAQIWVAAGLFRRRATSPELALQHA
jgi:hypothetical protein